MNYVVKLCDQKGAFEIIIDKFNINIAKVQLGNQNINYIDAKELLIANIHNAECLLFKSGRILVKTHDENIAKEVAEFITSWATL